MIETCLINCAINIRKAYKTDLDAINKLIGRAIKTWHLADRVKRLSLPLYCYDENDLEHLQILVAETADLSIAGISALEPVESPDSEGRSMSLIHGLYVDPVLHQKSIGTSLLEASELLAHSQAVDGLLVKAQPEAIAFFEHQGYQKLSVKDPSRQYPYRLWKDL